MKLLIDADALPRPVRDTLCQTAERECVVAIFVAGRAPFLPQSAYLRAVSAGSAFDGADDWIVAEAEAGDLVITADIPLADRALNKGAAVLNPRGDFFTASNIKHALAMRELMSELRITGEVTGGAPPYSDKNRQAFANALNHYMQKAKRGQ